VSGQVRAGADVVDLIEACFPGGSMTGAPKRRAVQILASIEGGPRGLYSGCYGWLGGFGVGNGRDGGGEAELAMSIRCIELRGTAGAGQRALIGAGGGVTSDSVPLRELAEKQLKASALLTALCSG